MAGTRPEHRHTARVRAASRSRYGGPDLPSVEEVVTPTPDADELLVRVRATTVIRTDCGILLGKPFVLRFVTGVRRPRSRVPGTDFAGEVVQTGSAVTDLAVGERVWCLDDGGLGSHAQFLTIRQDAAVARIPDGVRRRPGGRQYGTEGAHYALNFMMRARYVPCQRVCVYGATGAIGSAAVQLLVAEAVRSRRSAVPSTPTSCGSRGEYRPRPHVAGPGDLSGALRPGLRRRGHEHVRRGQATPARSSTARRTTPSTQASGDRRPPYRNRAL